MSKTFLKEVVYCSFARQTTSGILVLVISLQDSLAMYSWVEVVANNLYIIQAKTELSNNLTALLFL